MLVSYKWLNELVDLHDLTPEIIAKRMTLAGVEVESINKLSSANHLVVGYVKECELVKDTHLHLCKVDLGSKYGEKQIICGAPNVRKDLKVIVALPGAELPGGTIKAATIHGMESNGMCCSLLELGVDAKYVDEIDLSGIHELGDEFVVGDENVLEHLGLDDTVLTLKLLANRPDLLSIYNVAKEIGTLFNREVKDIPIEKINGEPVDFKVGSETKKCPQFSARVIKGITVKESPVELKKHLIAMGVRPINNVVDIGNLVMLLTGQPVHMYDLDKLPKPELIVKDKIEGEFKALDKNAYPIRKGDLVVTSDNRAMCLAGIMGGIESSDSSSTKNIVIEVANFNHAAIRRTSIYLNLISESSIRYTHGINDSQYVDVMNLATSLVKKYCGASSVSEIITYDTINHKEKKITVSAKKINAILGTNYDLNKIMSTLKLDHFTIQDVKKSSFVAIAPKHRIDIDGINDLAEEVVRILGYQDVKNELPALATIPGVLSNKQRKEKEIKKYLSTSLYQVLTYVLVNAKRANEFIYLNKDKPYKLINPMTDDHEYVRPSLIPSLLDVVSYNLAHQNKDFGIYEISDINVNDKKETYLGIVLTGEEKLQGELMKVPYSFYSLKGYLEAIMSMLGINKSRYLLKEWDLGGTELHPGRSATLYLGKELIGYLGELHPSAYPTYNIKNHKVYVMEIKLSSLLNLVAGNEKFKAISRFPSVTRDLALVVKDDVKAEQVITIIKKNGGVLVRNVEVFDIYKDENMKDTKSVAVTITLGKDDATLKDQETNETIEKIKAALLKENISIR
ncbi:MAG: phenylalanine--tRNA ligase subunit beta [Bacilli bacterium]|nr:phenylalanine--tRNA ligase subunit beta [Bacilli bacterium]